MVEAVNAVISNSSVLRGTVENVSTTRSFAANPDRVQEAASAPQVPYISPYISVDTNYNKAVLQIRDSDTGDVIRQFPSESRLQQVRQQEQRAQAQQEVSEASQPSQQRVEPTSVQVVSNSNAGAIPAGVAEAQIATAALSAGAQAGVSVSSGFSTEA